MIQIGNVIGGSRADWNSREPNQRLKNLLRRYTDKTYSESIDDLMIVICISGEIKDYKFEGFDRLRMKRKKKQLWIDYGIKKDFFKDKSEKFIKEFLLKIIEEALEKFFRRIEKEKIIFDKNELLTDFQKVSKVFLDETD